MPFDDFELRVLECSRCGGPLPVPSSGMAETCGYCGAPSADAREVGVFSHDIRVVVCDGCMAPLPVPLVGGEVTCGYCSSTYAIVPRNQRRLGSDDPVDEAARLARLRTQDTGPIRMPRAIRPLMEDGGLIDSTIDQAQDMWQYQRAVLRAHPEVIGTKAELNFYFLTELIADYHGWKQRRLVARAYLEASIEDLRDPRYMQPIYCWLARNAYHTGDAVASRTWFDLCDPAAEELGMDSAYRFTWAALALADGDYTTVLEALGASRAAIPLNDKYDSVATVFRAHAFEHLEGPERAADHLLAEVGKPMHCWTHVVLVVESEDRTRLLPRSLALAAKRRWSLAGPIAMVVVFAAGMLFLLADQLVGPRLWGQRLLGKPGIALLALWPLIVGGLAVSQLSSARSMRRKISALDTRG